MIIDCDTHICPRDAMDYLGEFAHMKPIFNYDENGHHTDTTFPKGWFADHWGDVPGTSPVTIDGGTGEDYDGMYDMDARVADLVKLGVDKQLLMGQYTPWVWSYLLEPKLATAMAHSYNLSILKILKDYGDHFYGACLVALQDVPSAIKELEWAKENGFRAVNIDETFPVREHPFGEPPAAREELWPFFAKCEELDMPVFLHRIQHGHRILNVPTLLKYGLDMFAPDNVHVTLACFITSGMLDAYPNLKIVETETGVSWLRPLIEKMQLWFHRPPVAYIDEAPVNHRRRLPARASSPLGDRRDELQDERNKEEPIHYFRKNFWFTTEPEESVFADAVNYLGADRFLFATDYPHDDPGGMMKWRDVELLRKLKGLSASDKELIFGGNAEKVLGLG